MSNFRKISWGRIISRPPWHSIFGFVEFWKRWMRLPDILKTHPLPFFSKITPGHSWFLYEELLHRELNIAGPLLTALMRVIICNDRCCYSRENQTRGKTKICEKRKIKKRALDSAVRIYAMVCWARHALIFSELFIFLCGSNNFLLLQSRFKLCRVLPQSIPWYWVGEQEGRDGVLASG